MRSRISSVKVQVSSLRSRVSSFRIHFISLSCVMSYFNFLPSHFTSMEQMLMSVLILRLAMFAPFI